jgi:hypothetical protein
VRWGFIDENSLEESGNVVLPRSATEKLRGGRFDHVGKHTPEPNSGGGSFLRARYGTALVIFEMTTLTCKICPLILKKMRILMFLSLHAFTTFHREKSKVVHEATATFTPLI